MARKAIVLDLDGTLLDSQKAVSPRSVGAIQACLLEGHLVIVATARALRTTLRLLPADLHSCYLVLCNGARTVRGGSVVYRNEIAAELVLRLTEELIAIGLSPAIETDDQLYSDLKAAGSPAWESRPLGEYPRTAACKLLALIAAGMNEMILRKLIPPELDYVITDRGTLLQIQVRSCSKATASRAIFEVEKVALGDTYAFGDDTNDICLFESVGMGIAMGNAVPELKNVAHSITLPNDADGVAHGIARFVLANDGGNTLRGFMANKDASRKAGPA